MSEVTLSFSYSRKQNYSWKANRFAACQEIHRILCNLKVYYRIHKVHVTRPYPETARFNPYSNIPPLNIHTNINLPSTPP